MFAFEMSLARKRSGEALRTANRCVAFQSVPMDCRLPPGQTMQIHDCGVRRRVRKLGYLSKATHVQSATFSFSPDRRLSACISGFTAFSLWDMETLSEIPIELEKNSGWMSSISFSSDGHRIVTGGGAGTVHCGISQLESKWEIFWVATREIL